MLTILGGLAEFERELIRTRTSEGRAHAKANGKSVGRKPKLTPHQKRKPFAGATRASQSADRTHLQCQCQYDFEIDRLAACATLYADHDPRRLLQSLDPELETR